MAMKKNSFNDSFKKIFMNEIVIKLFNVDVIKNLKALQKLKYCSSVFLSIEKQSLKNFQRPGKLFKSEKLGINLRKNIQKIEN